MTSWRQNEPNVVWYLSRNLQDISHKFENDKFVEELGDDSGYEDSIVKTFNILTL